MLLQAKSCPVKRGRDGGEGREALQGWGRGRGGVGEGQGRVGEGVGEGEAGGDGAEGGGAFGVRGGGSQFSG